MLRGIRLTEAINNFLPTKDVYNVSHEEICENPEKILQKILDNDSHGIDKVLDLNKIKKRHDIGGSVGVTKSLKLEDIKMDSTWKDKVTIRMNLGYFIAKKFLNNQSKDYI